MGLEERLKAHARELGLDLVGICSCAPFERDRSALADREARGFRSSFEEREIGRRVEPELLLPGCRSIIAAGICYLPEQDAPPPPDDPPGLRGWLSRYCRGVDYHRILREKLGRLAAWLQAERPAARVHVCVDTEPPVDRSVAERAGLGFYGKSTMLITREYGTWVFLGEILTDLELQPDEPWTGTCGQCTRCIDACPTGALVAPYTLDSLRCLSYVTQMKGYIPEEYREPLGNMLFGCDICQDVCPYNRRPRLGRTASPELAALPQVGGDAGPLLERVLGMSNAEFRAWFHPTAAGWRGKTVLQRNAVIALGNSGDARALPPLLAALRDPQRPLLRGTAAWALGKLGRTVPETAAAAAGALRELLGRETDPRVRREAEAALARLEPGGEPAPGEGSPGGENRLLSPRC